jgi:tetratricopeptide (TPR) repeat protein
MPTSLKSLKQTIRFATSVALLALFPILIWNSARAGFASLLSTYASRINQIAPTNAAVGFAPGDPEAHYWRGAILDTANDLTGAIAEYEQAIKLRPDDYVLWLSLARARELNGDPPGAIAAARQALPLAPYYAQPHWQLGNILIRAGQRDEGFKELRLAGASDPKLLPGIIDLAWQMSGGDVQFVKQAVQPQSTEAYKALVENFKKHDKVDAAVALLAEAGAESRTERGQYVNVLITGKRFKEAYDLWSHDHAANPHGDVATMTDPGFEQESNLEEPGFGWRLENKAPSLSLSLDASNPKEGRSSLRVEFNGDSDPGQKILSQLVMLEPGKHYHLEFVARTEDIVSGGLPSIAVADASDNVVLGQPVVLPQQTANWQNYSIDFNSNEKTTAIQIFLRREQCGKSPCPIFGRLWLDAFSLQKR